MRIGNNLNYVHYHKPYFIRWCVPPVSSDTLPQVIPLAESRGSDSWRHTFYFGQPDSIQPAEIVCILAEGRWHVNNRQHPSRHGNLNCNSFVDDSSAKAVSSCSAASNIWVWGQGCSLVIGFKCYKLHTYTKIDFTVSSASDFLFLYLFTLGINISTGNLIGSGTFFTVPEHLVADSVRCSKKPRVIVK